MPKHPGKSSHNRKNKKKKKLTMLECIELRQENEPWTKFDKTSDEWKELVRVCA